MTNGQAADLIINIRQSATSLINSLNHLINSLNQFRSVQAAYVGFDALNTLTDDQFTGQNEGLTAADVHTAVATIDAVLTGLNAKTIGDVYKLKS